MKKTPGYGEGGQRGYERRIEVIVKMQKKSWGVMAGGGGGEIGVGVRVDMNK